MIIIEKLIFVFVVVFQVSIWPVGIWMMITGYGGHDPDTIGRAMATLILVGMVPIFLISR